MKVEIIRTELINAATLGRMKINGKEVCKTLEDIEREVKIYAQTAIPAGLYKLQLRNIGKVNELYKKRYGNWHKGMIEICNVPDYEGVLIHCGNTISDTAGCVLVGDVTLGDYLKNSRVAYERIYPEISNEILRGNNVYLEIISKI